ncbi:MAG: HEAT repeat domain-containing protein, partial [Verrucomicrobiota bacterium]|nr:HEAT repeat domain-containing protein [Verrucomicrobiota bacterium]
MQTKNSFRSGIGCFALSIAMLAGFALLLLPEHARAAENASAKEEKFLAVLQSSSAPPQEKAVACKQLAIYGSSKSVPALASLLGNPELASWARIALEVIPDPSADKALRDALAGLNGKLLVGAINSIGRRRDAGAVPALVAHLKHADADVASAAAAALGQIGGSDAASALKSAMAAAQPGVKSAVAEGLVRAAEQFLASGKKSEAMDLYDFVRKSDVPKQRVAEAIRGAILARGEAGVPLLLDQLKSPDKTMVAVGLRVARELEGRAVTAALAAAMKQLEPARQPLLLMAIGDRNDSAVLPAVRDAARTGSKELQLAALGILENIGDVSCVSDLLLLAAGPDANLAKAAKSTLAKMGSADVDNEIIARLSKSTGAERRVLIETVSQRQLVKALPAITGAIS